MAFGVAEDVVRAPDLVSAKARMTLVRLAGFTSVRVTSQWLPGQTAPPEAELQILRNVVAAAQLSGVRIYLSVYPPGSRSTPLTAEAREEFAAYVTVLAQQLPSVDDVIVGNEPNLNRFWLPQFNPDGSDAAAPAYLALLARSYDAIKAVDPSTRVWGGALAPRGVDRPNTGRDTHSPVAFLRDMGAAFRASGRTTPVMDGLAFHPYADSSGQSPDTPHPRSTTIGLADYDRLVATLAEAFDGSAQPGSTLPILYDEFGVESRIPAGKAQAYSGKEPATTRPVDEITQGQYYGRALQLAFCQPNVTGILLFHSQDEPALASWQSGVYYADGTPKSSLYAVRDALARARGGSIARCEGLALDVAATKVRFPTQGELLRGLRDVRFTCSLDCAWELRAIGVSTSGTAARVTGYGRAGVPLVASLKGRRLGPGQVRLVLTLRHPVNPGVPVSRESRALSIR
ncbi:hypothetical protein Gocc_1050 [Gaiella occulta]|uniref:Glycosyl hydrolase catalytic core n=2 Tax=Gaiella occulta TaxID=1002870 RepID=A0A7M2Z0N2_9ACTN|nr:hypothetical protein Gocc_1050 [Gaiella occulta]